MGQPIWQVRNTDLGTIAENIFFEYGLEAIDTDGFDVSYSVVAGTLPIGIQITGTNISGIPAKITGIPADVDVDTSSKFSIRATTTTGNVSDITFDLAVSGQKVPHLITPSGQLAEFYYGNYVDIQIDAIDEDVDNILEWSIKGTPLPDGLSLTVDPDNDRIAYVRGYPAPVSALASGTGVGFDNQEFDEDLGAFGFDYGLVTIDKNYEFSVSITDGTGFDSRKFSIFLRSKFNLSADLTDLTADSLLPTVDITTSISPIITSDIFDYGQVLHDNYFAAQITAFDFESDELEYRVFSGTLPNSLTLDSNTGWLHGYLDSVVLAEQDYAFEIVAAKVNNPDIISLPATYTMTVIGDLLNQITVNSPTIMSLNNGSISELAIDATANFEGELSYSLTSGSLPPGLLLASNGLIIGRPIFLHFTLDNSTTTIDGGFTHFGGSFDNTYTFTVNIIDTTVGLVNVNKEFTIIVLPANDAPYENLYLVSKPNLDDRLYYRQLTEDEAILPPDDIYRGIDPNFGISSDLRFLLADGLSAKPIAVYAEALEQNHYTRNFIFGDLKIAKSIKDGDVIYELIYSDIIDSLLNSKGESTSPSLLSGTNTLYPASLVNMRNRIFDIVGRVSKNTLPGWMTSIQDNNRALGFINAVPVVYCKPGTAEKILFDINNSGFDINNIDFTVDRYIWDNNLTDFNAVVSNIDIDENDQMLKFPFNDVFR